MAEYGNVTAPETLLGMLVQARASVRIGTQELWGSLETTSDTYTAYGASIGLTANSFDLGELGELGVTMNATVETFESVNVRQPTIYYVSEEEATITTGVSQFDYRVFELMFHNGVMQKLEAAANNEYLITVGGSCAIKSRPMTVGVSNIACFLPGGADAEVGITGIIITFYDVLCQTGLVWDNITAKEIDTLSLEWSARPVLSNALGNQLANIYLF